MDYIGGMLLAVSIGAILLALTKLNLGYLLLGIVALALFILRILRAASPFVQPAVFRNRSYTWGMFISFLLVACGFSIPFIIPQLLTNVYDAYPALTGLIMLPSALIAALLGRRGGTLADKKGNAYLMYTASMMLVIGFISLSLAGGVSLIFVSSFLVLAVLGQSYMQIALSNTIAQTLSRNRWALAWVCYPCVISSQLRYLQQFLARLSTVEHSSFISILLSACHLHLYIVTSLFCLPCWLW